MQYTEIFSEAEIKNFIGFYFFLLKTNIDCDYMLEPPRRGFYILEQKKRIIGRPL